jgi:predicted Zn-ribbon and HTH transcriptional regulator
MMNCPQCHSERIHRSRRKGFMEGTILTILFVRPFRCERCDLRFFRWSITVNPNSSTAATTIGNHPSRSNE